MLDVGGLEFTACPFNGWYMGTEIGRDLADINRYNKLPIIAEKMGLDTMTNMSLWKDKALIELNYAILYSFQVFKLIIFKLFHFKLYIIL
jgi:nitric-oxide synthase